MCWSYHSTAMKARSPFIRCSPRECEYKAIPPIPVHWNCGGIMRNLLAVLAKAKLGHEALATAAATAWASSILGSILRIRPLLATFREAVSHIEISWINAAPEHHQQCVETPVSSVFGKYKYPPNARGLRRYQGVSPKAGGESRYQRGHSCWH